MNLARSPFERSILPLTIEVFDCLHKQVDDFFHKFVSTMCAKWMAQKINISMITTFVRQRVSITFQKLQSLYYFKLDCSFWGWLHLNFLHLWTHWPSPLQMVGSWRNKDTFEFGSWSCTFFIFWRWIVYFVLLHHLPFLVSLPFVYPLYFSWCKVWQVRIICGKF